MSVGELMELLEQYPEDMEVLVGHQPSWPLAETVDAAQSEYDLAMANECEAHEERECMVCAAAAAPVVWLVAGGHPEGRSPYAPGALFGSGY